MKAVLVNYNFTPTWLLDSNVDYLIYDRSNSKDWLKDFDQSKIIYEENIGQVDFPKLSYLIESYDALPDVFLWGKTNLFKYITEEEFEKVKDNQFFTSLLTQNHRTYRDELGVVCYYEDGMYYERNDSWYAPQFEGHFNTYEEFAQAFHLPSPPYLAFAPGGNYILTKEVVHKLPKEYYREMANTLPHCQEPREAHFCERSYYNIWK